MHTVAEALIADAPRLAEENERLREALARLEGCLSGETEGWSSRSAIADIRAALAETRP